MNGYTNPFGGMPSSHDGKIAAATYNKNNMYKIDTNRLALGDYRNMAASMIKIEADVAKALRDEKIVTNLNWKKLPFKWNPAAYGRFDGIPEKDPTLGQPSNLAEFYEFSQNGRYEATEIHDLRATLIEYAVKGLGEDRAKLNSQEANGEKSDKAGMV